MLPGLWRTIAIIYVAVALSPLIGVAVYESWRFVTGAQQEDPWRRDSVTAPERAEELARRGVMEQIITFRGEPVGLRKNPKTDLFDLYAIGVGQTTLPDERPTGGSVHNLIGPAPSPNKLRYASSFAIAGQFNNIVLLETQSGALTTVFSNRLGVSSFKYIVGPTFEVLIVLATENDSNKDGRLNDFDLREAYVYSIKDRSLHKLLGLTGSPVDVIDMPGQRYALLRVIRDGDRDGTVDEYAFDRGIPEPATFVRIDLETYETAPLLPDAMLDQLQQTLEARKPVVESDKP